MKEDKKLSYKDGLIILLFFVAAVTTLYNVSILTQYNDLVDEYKNATENNNCYQVDGGRVTFHNLPNLTIEGGKGEKWN